MTDMRLGIELVTPGLNLLEDHGDGAKSVIERTKKILHEAPTRNLSRVRVSGTLPLFALEALEVMHRLCNPENRVQLLTRAPLWRGYSRVCKTFGMSVWLQSPLSSSCSSNG